MKSLTIDLSLRSFVHLKDKSVYDSNYYHVETDTSVSLYGNTVLHEEYDECANIFTFTLGRFDGTGKFVGVFSWDGYAAVDEL